MLHFVFRTFFPLLVAGCRCRCYFLKIFSKRTNLLQRHRVSFVSDQISHIRKLWHITSSCKCFQFIAINQGLTCLFAQSCLELRRGGNLFAQDLVPGVRSIVWDQWWWPDCQPDGVLAGRDWHGSGGRRCLWPWWQGLDAVEHLAKDAGVSGAKSGRAESKEEAVMFCCHPWGILYSTHDPVAKQDRNTFGWHEHVVQKDCWHQQAPSLGPCDA